MDTEIERAEIKLLTETHKSLLVEFEELSKVVAKKQKIYYDSLILEGFEDIQALEIVIQAGFDALLNTTTS